MKAKVFTLILLFLIQIFAGVEAAPNEGYGEDSTALGQFVDSFNDSENISIAYEVIRNSTLNAMELNFTASSIINEDFTDYTETDPNGRFTVTIPLIIVENLSNHDRDHRVWFDYGAGFFENFTINYELRIRDTGGVAGNDRMWSCFFANLTDDGNDLVVANEEIMGVYTTEFDLSDPNTPHIDLREYENGILNQDFYRPASLNTWYYLTFRKAGTNLTLGIYSTAALRDAGNGFDGDLDNLQITLGGNWKFRYIYGVNSHNTGTPTVRLQSGDIRNFTMGGPGGYIEEGWFSSVDYLSDPLANGSALVAMLNTSIPANTQILLEFSEDNITWVLDDWDPLVGGFESVDLRNLNYSTGYYIRLNLSTSDIQETPRVYQSRLITTLGNDSIITEFQNVTGAWEYYNLSAIAVVTGIHDDGNLASTYSVDGDTYNCSEVVGVPGYEVKFNITGIDPAAISLWLVNYVWYSGSASHEVNVELWNYTAGAYVEIGEIPDMAGFAWQNFTIYPLRIPLEFVNSSGVMVGRFYHVDAGNINHDIIFDRISLYAFIPTAAAAEEVFQFFWIVIGIALMLIGLVLSKMWFEGRDP